MSDPAPAGPAGPRPDESFGSIAPLSRPLPPAAARVFAVIAAAALIAACFSHRWLANRYIGDFGFSPLALKACPGTGCESTSNFELYEKAKDIPFEEARISIAFPVAGLVTFIALLMAAVGLLVATALAVTGRRPELPIAPTTVALLGVMVGLISGCIFVATKPGGVGAIGVAWSFWAFGVGAVLGIAGAQLLAKQIRPVDPDLLHDAMNPDQF